MCATEVSGGALGEGLAVTRFGRFSQLLLVLTLVGQSSVLRAEQPSIPPAPAGAASAAANYIIGPGDVLQVFVWRNPELSVTVPVRPDGRVSTPLVEDMVAVGKTPSVLARDIEKTLGEYIRSPQVNVIVSTPASTLSQVKAIGQLKSPQGVPFREGMRVLDLVLAAGGMTDFAAGNRAKIVRSDGTAQSTLKVRLADLVNKGDMKENLLLKAGDVLIVPESRL